MRKILFRGKRIDSGEWVEGHYGEYMLMSGESIPCISIPKKEAVCGSICYDVEASTVGQYTGLTDKNGKKAFEGDIIKIPYCCHHGYAVGFVYYDSDETAYCAKCGGIKYQLGTDLSYDSIEIIGNIHDNSQHVVTKRDIDCAPTIIEAEVSE